MENNQNVNVNENQETQEQAVNQQAQEPEVEEVTVIEVKPWMAKVIKVGKKVLKIALPLGTAAVGAVLGIKYGQSNESKKSQAQADALNGTIEDLRRQLDERPVALPEFSEVASDIPEVMDIVE